MDFNPNPDPKTVKDAQGLTTTYEYDIYGNRNKTTVETGSGTIVSGCVYDVRSRMSTMSGTLEPNVTVNYDAQDRKVLTAVTDPSGFPSYMPSSFTAKTSRSFGST